MTLGILESKYRKAGFTLFTSRSQALSGRLGKYGYEHLIPPGMAVTRKGN